MSTTKVSDLLLKEYKEALRKEVIADVKDSIYALTDVETKVKAKYRLFMKRPYMTF